MSNNISGKVSAIYTDEIKARKGLKAVLDNSGLSSTAVKLVSPHDNHFDKKLVKDDKQVGSFMLKAHLSFAIFGVILGLLSAGILAFYGPSYTQASPGLTAMALSVLGFFFGLMLAGFVSLRPDQDGVVNQTRSATEEGKWVVVVNTPSHEKTQQVDDILNETAESVTSSF
ncbi:hypothetical protein [Paraglaciecola sp. 20A4]|uniref:hypothetical protein n=1 Tax=Paraglaciecola sp. 20A4 TaxID=2687288 RepID=UPI00140E769F|nr:hypothetical protein [Paraglaciecola sp. 20A4]